MNIPCHKIINANFNSTELHSLATETVCFDSGTFCFEFNRQVSAAKTISYKQLVIDLLILAVK